MKRTWRTSPARYLFLYAPAGFEGFIFLYAPAGFEGFIVEASEPAGALTIPPPSDAPVDYERLNQIMSTRYATDHYWQHAGVLAIRSAAPRSG